MKPRNVDKISLPFWTERRTELIFVPDKAENSPGPTLGSWTTVRLSNEGRDKKKHPKW